MTRARVTATYDYIDEGGTLLYQVERLEPKAFRQRRPAPDGSGRWILHLDPQSDCARARYGCVCRDFSELAPARRVIYRLPEVIAVARQRWRIYVVEGEKDADALVALGLCATTGPMGAGKWRAEYADQLASAEVVAIADKDDAGRTHAKAVALSCSTTRSVKVIELPGDHVKDAADWISAGGTREQLEALADAAPEWRPIRATQETARLRERTGSDGARAIPASSVKRERVGYLDAERMIPLKAATVLAGPPGLGKSQWTARLAACNAGVTLIATAEDALGAIVRPRLEAAGADLQRVSFVVMSRDGLDDGIALPDDVAELERLVEENAATLVVIDPLMAHLPEHVNSWRDQSIRRALAPLHRLAERHGCAVVVVVHLNKREGDDPLQRVGGSIGITGAARSVLLLARDPEDPEGEVGRRRVLAHVKSNYGPLQPSRALRIEAFLIDPEGERIDTSRILDEGESPHLGRDLLADVERDAGKRGEAVAFLLEQLGNGPQPARALPERAGERHISRATLRRAKDELGIVSERLGFGHDGQWWWRLPRAPRIDAYGPVAETSTYDEGRDNRGVSLDPGRIDAHGATQDTDAYDSEPMLRAALEVFGPADAPEASPSV